MKMPQKWNLLYFYAERHPQDLRDLVYDMIPKEDFIVEMVDYTQKTEIICKKMDWADVVLFAPARELPEIVFQHAKHIKLMQIWSSGYDKFPIEYARRYNIPVSNNGGANRITVAEHTILLMLATYKKLPESHARTIEGRWTGNRHGMDMYLMHGKTLGIIGLGNIGKEVVKRASAFNMNILYYDIERPDVITESELNCSYAPFLDLLKKSDIISLHVHLNNDTYRMIGKNEISMMKKNAVIINTSRAELIDNKALCRALYDNKIWGAAFDVYEVEPTEPGDPLLIHPNVVATPHMANTYDSHIMVMNACISNLLRVKSGKEPLWVL